MRIYYQDYAKDFPMITRATWGYTVETATLAIRLVLSGVFEKYPKLKSSVTLARRCRFWSGALT